jgi:hypothetical protein
MIQLTATLITELLPEQNLKIYRIHGHALSAARINQNLKNNHNESEYYMTENAALDFALRSYSLY